MYQVNTMQDFTTFSTIKMSNSQGFDKHYVKNKWNLITVFCQKNVNFLALVREIWAAEYKYRNLKI